MKMNRTGGYEILDDGVFIQDPNTGERMVFLLDEKGKVVFRSMLEEDIKEAVNIMDISRSQKREKMRFLWKCIPKKGSEKFFFVAEKILESHEENPYEKGRKIIGLGLRTDDGIKVSVCEEAYIMRILKLVQKLAEHYGMEGVPYIQTK